MGMADQAVSTRLAAKNPDEAEFIERAYRQFGMTGVLRAEAESCQRTGAIFEAARCYAQLGQNDRVFNLLGEYYKRNYPGLSRLRVDPDFDPVRSDSRFKDLLQRVAFPHSLLFAFASFRIFSHNRGNLRSRHCRGSRDLLDLWLMCSSRGSFQCA